MVMNFDSYDVPELWQPRDKVTVSLALRERARKRRQGKAYRDSWCHVRLVSTVWNNKNKLSNKNMYVCNVTRFAVREIEPTATYLTRSNLKASPQLVWSIHCSVFCDVYVIQSGGVLKF